MIRDLHLAAQEGRVARDGRAPIGRDAGLALDDGLQPPHGIDGVVRLARQEEELADGLADAPRELREGDEAARVELAARGEGARVAGGEDHGRVGEEVEGRRPRLVEDGHELLLAVSLAQQLRVAPLLALLLRVGLHREQLREDLARVGHRRRAWLGPVSGFDLGLGLGSGLGLGLGLGVVSSSAYHTYVVVWL